MKVFQRIRNQISWGNKTLLIKTPVLLNKFLKTIRGDSFGRELHLRQPGLVWSACEAFKNSKWLTRV